MLFQKALQSLFLKLPPGVLILTPNERLTRFLSAEYNQYKTKNYAAWPRLNIQSLTQWTENLFKHSQFFETKPKLLLNTWQENTIWENIIRREDQHLLSHMNELIEQVKKAWEIVWAWDIPLNHPEFLFQEDYTWFQKVALQFEHFCQKENYLSKAQIPSVLQKKLTTVKDYIPREILLFGFDDLSPAYQNILDTLSAFTNIQIEHIEITATKPIQYRFATASDEIRAMAHWAQNAFAEGKTHIACIVPDLLAHRREITEIFTDVFYENTLFLPYHQTRLFSLSGGESLGTQSTIKTLMTLLRTCREKIHFEDFSMLLNSPYLKGGFEETSARNLLEYKLRDKLYQTMTLKHLEQILNDQEEIPFLKAIVTHIVQFVKKHKHDQKPFSHWLIIWEQLFHQVGWPGKRLLSSHEYQEIKQFTEVCHELAKIDYITLQISFVDSIKRLMQAVNKTIFQPKTDIAPVQVLGLLEALGQGFEAIWIMGLSDMTWPAAANPNPFIPQVLQKTLKIPRSCAQREFEFANAVTQRLLNASEEIVFSFHKTDNQNTFSPSYLLQNIELVDAPEPNATSSFSLTPLEYITTSPIPINNRFYGDSSLIKKQVECPFQAFAHYRLKAKPLPSINFLSTKKSRGILLHQVLQIIWQTFPNLLTEDILSCHQDLLMTLIDNIIATFYTDSGLSLPDTFIELEQARLKKIIFAWLRLEAQREPFLFHAAESSYQLHFGNLTLNLKIDRIDKLANDKLLLLDYKSGIVTPAAWFADEFTNPQLPIYTLLFDDVVGLAFACIHPNELTFKGLLLTQFSLPNLKLSSSLAQQINTFVKRTINYDANIDKTLTAEDFKMIKSAWKIKSETIAHIFLAGDPEVKPLNQNICELCDRHMLCRIYDQEQR